MVGGQAFEVLSWGAEWIRAPCSRSKRGRTESTEEDRRYKGNRIGFFPSTTDHPTFKGAVEAKDLDWFVGDGSNEWVDLGI